MWITRLVSVTGTLAIGAVLFIKINEIINNPEVIGNITDAAPFGATVLKIVPGFFALAILGIAIAVIYSMFRQVGGFGEYSDDETLTEEEFDEPAPHKQTYLEYVKERMAVEKEFRGAC